MKQAHRLEPVVSFESGIRLTLRTKPGVSCLRRLKIVDIGDGQKAIEVSVRAEAQEGKANKAVIERLSEELGVPKKNIAFMSGETSRLKVVKISGDPDDLIRRLQGKLDV